MNRLKLLLLTFIILEILVATSMAFNLEKLFEGNYVMLGGEIFHFQNNIGYAIDTSEPIMLDHCPLLNESGIYLKHGCTEIVNYTVAPVKQYNVTINSNGLRDYEYPIDHPNGTYRIIFIGDSVVYGVGVNLNETEPKILESMIRNDVSKNVEVLNFGAPGSNTLLEYEWLKRDVPRYRPDMVIVGYHFNDLEDYADVVKCRDEVTKTYKNENLSQAEAFKIVENANEACVDGEEELINQRGLDAMWPRVSEPLNGIYNLSKEYNFSVVVAITLVDGQNMGQIQKLEVECKKYGFEFIDTTSYIKNVTNDYSNIGFLTVSNVDRHPNALGQRLLAEQIFNGLNLTFK